MKKCYFCGSENAEPVIDGTKPICIVCFGKVMKYAIEFSCQVEKMMKKMELIKE